MRDKFLTEAMGECWHENVEANKEKTPGWFYCIDCGKFVGDTLPVCRSQFINLSTWQGFGKLWEFGQEQEWWKEFTMQTKTQLRFFINPDRFANAVYVFLKERT